MKNEFYQAACLGTILFVTHVDLLAQVQQATPAATTSPATPTTLIEQVKKRDLERQKAEKERLLSDIKGEFNKADQQAQRLQKGIEATDSLLGDTAKNLQVLKVQAERFKSLGDLTTLRADSESAKVDALKLLKDAQLKDADVLEKKIEDLYAQVAVIEFERDNLALPSSSVPADLSNKRKARETTLAALDKTTTDAEKAHSAASQKLEDADAKAVKANRMAIDLGLVSESGEIKATPTPQ